MHCEYCPLLPSDKDDECGFFDLYGKDLFQQHIP